MSGRDIRQTTVSKQALKRMPYYVQYLERAKNQGIEYVSAPAIASELSLNEVQVRKDLAAVSSTHGRPRSGFLVNDLLHDLVKFLDYDHVDGAILIGAGSLGRALLSYRGFDDYGVQIMAAFDKAPDWIGKEVNGKHIYSMEDLKEVCERMQVRIGIIAVPAAEAQKVCDALVRCGILAVWNFAPVHLSAPENILIQNENMAASLVMLSKHLKEKLES